METRVKFDPDSTYAAPVGRGCYALPIYPMRLDGADYPCFRESCVLICPTIPYANSTFYDDGVTDRPAPLVGGIVPEQMLVRQCWMIR